MIGFMYRISALLARNFLTPVILDAGFRRGFAQACRSRKPFLPAHPAPIDIPNRNRSVDNCREPASPSRPFFANTKNDHGPLKTQKRLHVPIYEMRCAVLR